MLNEFRLDGRVALVTGSARGLGFEIARGMAAAGARVYINGTNEERLQHAAARLAERGVTVRAACFDVADEASAVAVIETIFAETGRFDILVNNVGVRMREPIEKIGGAELRQMLDVDLVAAFTLARVAAPLMARNGYGRIINISSIAGERARAGDAAYIIVKGGMNAMTRSFAAEFGPSGITCNAIMPGGFLTETNAHMNTPAMAEMFKARMPLGRAGHPPEIAGPAVFLASPAASYVTGVCLAVDGDDYRHETAGPGVDAPAVLRPRKSNCRDAETVRSLAVRAWTMPVAGIVVSCASMIASVLNRLLALTDSCTRSVTRYWHEAVDQGVAGHLQTIVVTRMAVRGAKEVGTDGESIGLELRRDLEDQVGLVLGRVAHRGGDQGVLGDLGLGEGGARVQAERTLLDRTLERSIPRRSRR